MTTPPNPLHIANTAQSMARSGTPAEAAVFNKVALVCMGVMAAASVLQVLHPFLRDLSGRTKEKHDKGHAR